jgi:hypothetical protein
MSDAGAELKAKIRQGAEPAELSELLDRLAEPERVAATSGLGGADLRALWRVSDGYRPVALVDIVPPSVPALQPVRHFGRNSMPMLTRFEKVFYRTAEQDPSAPSELYGLNVHVTRPLAGPGYFVTTEDRARGEVIIDYRRVPKVGPEGWPPIVDNEHGFRKLFYGFEQVDTLRRVSEHVTIGSAARKGRDMGAFFVLCRQERP